MALRESGKAPRQAARHSARSRLAVQRSRSHSKSHLYDFFVVCIVPQQSHLIATRSPTHRTTHSHYATRLRIVFRHEVRLQKPAGSRLYRPVQACSIQSSSKSSWKEKLLLLGFCWTKVMTVGKRCASRSAILSSRFVSSVDSREIPDGPWTFNSCDLFDRRHDTRNETTEQFGSRC
jgi:hypothetical protein